MTNLLLDMFLLTLPGVVTALLQLQGRFLSFVFDWRWSF